MARRAFQPRKRKPGRSRGGTWGPHTDIDRRNLSPEGRRILEEMRQRGTQITSLAVPSRGDVGRMIGDAIRTITPKVAPAGAAAAVKSAGTLLNQVQADRARADTARRERNDRRRAAAHGRQRAQAARTTQRQSAAVRRAKPKARLTRR